jgi:hypothetical protein
MTRVSPPRYPAPPARRPAQLRWNPWTLLLLLPLVSLLTPLYNKIEPRLLGLPFFYWSQLAGLLLGVLCTLIVVQKTRREFVVTDRPDLLDVDHLDEGVWR